MTLLHRVFQLMAGFPYMAAPVPFAYPSAPQPYASAVKYVNPYAAAAAAAAAASNRSTVFPDRHAVSLCVFASCR